MIWRSVYLRNLQLAFQYQSVRGCVVECGVWRGGMIAGLAEVLGPGRKYWLFDSFEGLPPVEERDGPAAAAWQADSEGPSYYNNCRAEMAEAEAAMKKSEVPNYSIVKGWFADTIPTFQPEEPIALLRLDCDWYESTITVLRHLVPQVAPGGLVIIDDYCAWDGCARAVHEYLTESDKPFRIREYMNAVTYFTV